ncbi:SDR family NAD(P)-dependent oxidoreductase [Sulfitobacter pontiacus]|uniref:SDR family NAD(P)-dependent oxidoreductase n=1 Tax=Sulfitobacter pontiacus TaxID=60137 RepID=UPI0027541FC7|nr:SDR family oxidoreductase [Sulfitobacter pontiacus]GLO79638.1 3-oxoacyl-ACP reductase [Sulfitobacter pontiacus]
MNDLDFSGKRVLVVGGSSGIGNGIARGFRTRRAEVHVWGTRATAEDYAGLEGSDLDGLHYAQVNVADFDELSDYTPPFDSLDVLVQSQGFVRYKQAEYAKKGWDEVMDININSVMHTATKFKPMLSAAKGSIVIVSSVSGLQANIGNPAYAASKAAAISLTKTLGQSWARDGIRVNGLAPGLVPTKLTAITTQNKERAEASLRAIPVRRMGTPEEMAGAAMFLASPLASYVQGHTLIADGGLTL